MEFSGGMNGDRWGPGGARKLEVGRVRLNDGRRMPKVDGRRDHDNGRSRGGDGRRTGRNEMANLAVIGIMRRRCICGVMVGIVLRSRGGNWRRDVRPVRGVDNARQIQPGDEQAGEQSQRSM